MNRITAKFQELQQTSRKALIGYLTIGDPTPETSCQILKAACAAGLDILELGVPFSDPTADGPVIQAGGQRALRAGMSLSKVLDMAARLRQETDTPMLLFSYYNPLFKYGLERLAKAAQSAGIDGLLVVDLPPEESAPLRAALAGTNLQVILLAAPTTRPDRLRMIAQKTQGFLYLITKAGTTGEAVWTRRHAGTPPKSKPSAPCPFASASASATKTTPDNSARWPMELLSAPPRQNHRRKPRRPRPPRRVAKKSRLRAASTNNTPRFRSQAGRPTVL